MRTPYTEWLAKSRMASNSAPMGIVDAGQHGLIPNPTNISPQISSLVYMKNHKTRKSSINTGDNTTNPCPAHAPMSETTTGADTVEPSPQSASLQELCGFHKFLQTWLADAKKVRCIPGDLAVALLMEILWETRTWTNDEGATAVAMEWPCSRWSRFGSQVEIHAALQNLDQKGIIRLVPCCCDSKGQDNEREFMVIELPWRDAEEPKHWDAPQGRPAKNENECKN